MQKEKTCGRCNRVKTVLDFNKDKSRKDGLYPVCKVCRRMSDKKYRDNNKDKAKAYYEKTKGIQKERRKEYFKEYRAKQSTKDKILKYNEENKEKIKQYHNKYYQDNKKAVSQKQKQKRKDRTEEEKEREREYQKAYKIKNRDRINKNRRDKNRERYNNNPLFKLQNNIRGLMYKSFRDKNYTKRGKAVDIVGLYYPELKKYLENNIYGFKIDDDGVDIDHIIPLHTATTEEELIKLNHHTNLQLLPSFYNRVVKKDNDFDSEGFKVWWEENKD